jgi:4-hydroxybenzoate polyprenyltransferase
MSELSTLPTSAPMRTGAILMGTIALVILVFMAFLGISEELLVASAIGGVIILAYFGFKVRVWWLRSLCLIAALLLALWAGSHLWGMSHIVFDSAIRN